MFLGEFDQSSVVGILSLHTYRSAWLPAFWGDPVERYNLGRQGFPWGLSNLCLLCGGAIKAITTTCTRSEKWPISVGVGTGLTGTGRECKGHGKCYQLICMSIILDYGYLIRFLGIIGSRMDFTELPTL